MTYHHRLAVPRIIAPGGPVSAALRTMLAHTEACDRQRLRDLRRAIANRIEADIALLDALDGDPDLEPSLGAPERVHHNGGWIRGGTLRDHATGQKHWADGSDDDQEQEDEHGGDIQDEPHDEEPDREPSFCGITVAGDQFHRGGNWGDCEPSLGSLGGTASACEGPQLDWAGGDAEDREICADVPCHRREALWRQPGEALTAARSLARALRPVARERGIIRDQYGKAHHVVAIGRLA